MLKWHHNFKMLKLAPEIQGECAEGDRLRTMMNGGNGDGRGE